MADYRREHDKLIQAVLQKRNMSQADLAEHMGVERATISRWLNGHNPLSIAEAFFLESMLKPVDNDIEKVIVPIYSSVPGNKDFDPDKDKMGTIALPTWLIGGTRDDCYITRIPGSADLAMVKPKTTYKPGDYAIIKVDEDYSIHKMDALHAQCKLDIKGVAVMILKVA